MCAPRVSSNAWKSYGQHVHSERLEIPIRKGLSMPYDFSFKRSTRVLLRQGPSTSEMPAYFEPFR
jgi:hypothetical protein